MTTPTTPGVALLEPRIVIGLDFGTTFSGFSIALYSARDQVDGSFTKVPSLLEEYVWPDSPIQYVKAPTTLLLSTVGNAPTWGWTANNNRHASSPQDFLRRFKLHLAKFTDSSNPLDPLADEEDLDDDLEPLPEGIDVISAIAIYLERISKFALGTAQKKIISSLTMHQVQWCLTVPAQWTEGAKAAMNIAAQRAGMIQGPHCADPAASPHELLIVLEPEAASLYSLHSIGAELDRNAAYMILDMGGGTVDIVAHGFSDDGRRLKELIVSDGALCGGSFVDQLFLRYLEENMPRWLEYRLAHPKDANKFLYEWERVKRSFNGVEVTGQTLSIPKTMAKFLPPKLLIESDDDDDTFNLPLATIQSFFDPVVEEILQLANFNVAALRKLYPTRPIFVLAVGGFAESKYVFKRIESFMAEHYPVVVKVRSPNNPGSVIAKGAALYGLNPNIISIRKARYTFGIEMYQPYSISDPDSELIENDDGDFVKVLQPFVYLNQDVPNDRVIVHECVPLSPASTEVVIPLLQSKDRSVTSRRIYCSHPSISHVVDLRIRIPPALEDRRICVEMSFGGTQITVRAYPAANKDLKFQCEISAHKILK